MRNAILFCGNLISNAFSALVGAAVLSNLEGALGHRGWRWLYWIEGAVTMLIAIIAAFILPDLPHNTKGFTAEEREVAVLRMTEDVGEADEDSAEQGPLDGLWMCLKDTKIYVMMFTFTAYVVGLRYVTIILPHKLADRVQLQRLLPNSDSDTRVLLCPDAAHVQPTMGFLLRRVAAQRMAHRPYPGEVLAHGYPHLFRTRRIRHLNGTSKLSNPCHIQ